MVAWPAGGTPVEDRLAALDAASRLISCGTLPEEEQRRWAPCTPGAVRFAASPPGAWVDRELAKACAVPMNRWAGATTGLATGAGDSVPAAGGAESEGSPAVPAGACASAIGASATGLAATGAGTTAEDDASAGMAAAGGAV